MTMNLTGAIDFLNEIGIGGIITETTGFIAQPVSAVILFCVGYNFSLEKGNRRKVFEICGLHLGIFAAICADGSMSACILCYGSYCGVEFEGNI